ncbi:hypothetical protein EMCRGX_G027560 [Ephydatia muelleri]
MHRTELKISAGNHNVDALLYLGSLRCRAGQKSMDSTATSCNGWWHVFFFAGTRDVLPSNTWAYALN